MRVKDIDIKIVRGDSYVLHVMKDVEVNEITLRSWLAKTISQAAEQGKSSITLPPAGCGENGFSLVACAKIMSQEVLRAAREGRGSLQEIIICLDTEEAFKIFEEQVYGYLRHMTEDLGWGPYVTTDIIIEVDGGVILIERTNPPFGWALPGGFVDNGESLESAARREAKEETNLIVSDLKQFHTYSEPSRDPRFHTVTTVFTAWGLGRPEAGDDAKGIRVVPFAELRKMQFAFDHGRVIEDYLASQGR